MQIGIDLGASKIESVVLSEDGKEHLREREPTPQSYNETINLIKKIVIEIERKFNKELNVGLCHPGCLLYTSPSPRDRTRSRMPSSA